MKKTISNFLKKVNYKIVKIKYPECYIISFPKSGRTWLNVLLGKLFEQHTGMSDMSTDNILNLKLFSSFFNDKIPSVAFSHDGNKNFFLPPKKLTKNKTKYKNTKVVFLVRDPRDVLVSSYFEKTKRIELGKRNDSFWLPFKGTIHNYVYEKNGGFETIIEFYNIWLKNRDVPIDFLLVKYEDMHNNTLRELNRITDFLKINVSHAAKEKAIEYASFDNMREIEKLGGTKSTKLKPADINDNATYKTRKGKIGDYKNHFTDIEIKYLTEKMNKTLSPFFGYS